MITYEYNGVKLPPLKRITGYNYALICSVTGELFYNYILMLVSKPYKVSDGKILFDTAGNYLVYVAGKNSTEWREGSLIITDEGANTTYASIDKDATFLWCNENITDYNTNEIKYIGTQPVEIPSAAKPVIINNLPNSKYYNQNDENIEPLEVRVSASDTDEGAVLSYQWYRDGKKIEGATSNSYIPPVDQMGEWKYQCKITNTYQEYTAFVNSNVVLVTVVQALKPINEEFLLGWKIGRIMAMLRGEIKPAVPDSTMYLYGTPSETGNIGLRSGGSVVYYNGAVLPKLPERQRNPYYCDSILKTDTAWVLLCTKREFDLQDENTVQYPYANTELWYSQHLFADGPFTEWGAIEYAENCNISVNKDVFMWSNQSVEDANLVCHLRGSAPIPVTDIVEWVNGVPIYEVKNPVVLYESSVTTVADGTKNGAYASFDGMLDLPKYGTYRIIVNSNTEYSREINPEYDAYVFSGNVWLSKETTTTNWKDDGGDHWIVLFDSWLGGPYIYTRAAGTYHIKIEWYDV